MRCVTEVVATLVPSPMVEQKLPSSLLVKVKPATRCAKATDDGCRAVVRCFRLSVLIYSKIGADYFFDMPTAENSGKLKEIFSS